MQIGIARVECDRCGLLYEGNRCHTRCPVCGAEVTCSDVTIYLTEKEQFDTLDTWLSDLDMG